MKEMRAKKVYPLGGLTLGLMFADGAFKKYDLKPLTGQIPAFKALHDRALFENAKVSAGGWGVVWNDEVDIAAEELYKNGKPWTDAPEEDKAVAELVERFVQLRKKANMTQQQIADKCGLKQSAVARIENGGREPQLSTLVKMAAACGMKITLGKK